MNNELQSRAFDLMGAPRFRIFISLLSGMLLSGAAFLPLSALAQTERVSVASGGTPGNRDSRGVDVSGDGRYVAFTSGASNLVAGGNTTFDIYVRDRQLGLTELVSKNNQGTSGDFTSLWPSISSDGRYVVFHSIARNLVPNDDNNDADVFLFDRNTDTITLVSKAPDGSPGNGRSQRAEISADGSYVIFQSGATDLVAGVPDGEGQIYGYRVATGTVELVSANNSGAPAEFAASEASVSRTGQFVVFRTFSQNLTTCPPDCGYIFVRDTVNGNTAVVPDARSVQAGRAAISGDGRYVAYSTNARTYLVDRNTGNAITLEQPDLTSNPRSWARFSDDGRFFVFWEAQTTSPSAPARLWRYDLLNDLAEIVSLDQNGNPVNPGAASPGTFGPPGISDDGNIVAFWSSADGVVDNDTGGIQDVYIRAIREDDQPPEVGPISVAPTSPLEGEAFVISASADDTNTGGAAIISGEFAIDGGTWLAASPGDGDFDSPVEVFELANSGLPAGPYEICVRATDGFGNTSDGAECAKLDVLDDSDNTPPAWPNAQLTATQVSALGVQLQWSPAVDGGSGLKEYVVYREDVEIFRLPARSFTDMVPRPGNYAYRVEAVDAALNESTTGPTTLIDVGAPPIEISIEERILVNDSVNVLTSLTIAIEETIRVLDDPLTLPALTIAIAEVIAVRDTPAVETNPGGPDPDLIVINIPNPPLLPGSIFSASAGGFKPFSLVQAFLESTPVLVGEENADADGDVRFVITVPANFPPGQHTLALIGVAPDDSPRRLTTPISIQARSDSDAVAIPGPNRNNAGLWVLLAVLLGTAMVRLRRDATQRS